MPPGPVSCIGGTKYPHCIVLYCNPCVMFHCTRTPTIASWSLVACQTCGSVPIRRNANPNPNPKPYFRRIGFRRNGFWANREDTKHAQQHSVHRLVVFSQRCFYHFSDISCLYSRPACMTQHTSTPDIQCESIKIHPCGFLTFFPK